MAPTKALDLDVGRVADDRVETAVLTGLAGGSEEHFGKLDLPMEWIADLGIIERDPRVSSANSSIGPAEILSRFGELLLLSYLLGLVLGSATDLGPPLQ